jgi:hypothetical protein
MKYSFRDNLALILVLLLAIITYARLNYYTWWLIGSYKGALVTIGVIGLAILALYSVELIKFVNISITAQTLLWLISATVIIASLFSKTTRSEFIWSVALIFVSWAIELSGHIMESSKHNSSSSSKYMLISDHTS